MRERPARLPASLHHSSSSCTCSLASSSLSLSMSSTSSSLARVRKEEAKRASLLDNWSLEENEGSLLEEIEGSPLEESEASLLCCNAASRLFRSLHRQNVSDPCLFGLLHPQFF